MPLQEIIGLGSDLAGRVDIREDFRLPFVDINIVFKKFPTAGIVHLPKLSDHQGIKACLQIDTRPNYIPKEALIIFDQDQKPRVAIVSGQEDNTTRLFIHQLDPEDKEVDLIGIGGYRIPLHRCLYHEASHLLPSENQPPGQLVITWTDGTISLKPITGDRLEA